MPQTPPPAPDRPARKERSLSPDQQQKIEEIIRRGVRRGDYQKLSDELDVYVQELFDADHGPSRLSS